MSAQPFDNASPFTEVSGDQQNDQFLPKEPMDLPTGRQALPREPKDLPLPEKELPKEPVEIPSTTTHEEPKPTTQPREETYPRHEVKTMLAWSAPGRPFQDHSRQYHMSILLIAFLFSLLAFLFSQYLLIGVIWSLVFMNYALTTVRPHDYHYRISTEGITLEDYFYLWEELYDFYFKHVQGHDVLHVRTRALLPGELTIMLGVMTKDHVRSVLLPFLPYREVVKPTFMEKSGDWLSRNFPLEPRKNATNK